MGTIVKRGTKYRAVVRKLGAKALTKTFDDKRSAKAWINETEMMVVKRQKIGGGMTLGEILLKFLAEVVQKRPYSNASNDGNIKRLAREFSHTNLADMTVSWWEKTVEGWTVAPSSRERYANVLSSALRKAERSWGVRPDWESYNQAVGTLRDESLIGHSDGRMRRVSDAELKAIYKHTLHTALIPTRDLIDFALSSCMRVSEIVNLKWSDVNFDEGNPMIYVEGNPMIWVRNRKHPKKKMGNHWNVPLLNGAYDIIKRQARSLEEDIKDYIFPFHAHSVSRAFERAVKRAGIKNLSFHDLRHEGISRLFEQGLAIQQVALVSGHKSWKALQIYTHLKPGSLHQALAKRAA